MPFEWPVVSSEAVLSVHGPYCCRERAMIGSVVLLQPWSCWCPWPVLLLWAMMLSVARASHRAVLMSVVWTATWDHAEVVHMHWGGRTCGYLWSLLSPEAMWISMTHASTDCKVGSYFSRVSMTEDSSRKRDIEGFWDSPSPLQSNSLNRKTSRRTLKNCDKNAEV